MKNVWLTFLLLLFFPALAQESESFESDTTYVDGRVAESAATEDSSSFANRLPADTTAFANIDPERTDAVAFRKNYKEHYIGRAFDYTEVPLEKSAAQRFSEWLARKFQAWFDIGDTDRAVRIVGYILKILLILIALGVAYFIARMLLRKEGRWIFAKSRNQAIFAYEEAVADIRSADLDALINDAIAANDLRLATRYHYLLLLKEMTQKGIIEFDKEKTNSDYFHEIKVEALRTRFGYLSYLYNYIWYGKFEVDEASYAKAAAAFRNTISTLP